MREFIQAKPDDAVCLAELYAKGFKATGFNQEASLENRDELVQSVRNFCSEGKVWFRSDVYGPTVLGHIDEEKNEVVLIVTRSDVEGSGEATAMLKHLVNRNYSVRVRPVTKRGEIVAQRCGFLPSKDDSSIWVLNSK